MHDRASGRREAPVTTLADYPGLYSGRRVGRRWGYSASRSRVCPRWAGGLELTTRTTSLPGARPLSGHSAVARSPRKRIDSAGVTSSARSVTARSGPYATGPSGGPSRPGSTPSPTSPGLRALRLAHVIC